MSTTVAAGTNLGVLARQEIGNYLRHKLFWFSAALTLLMTVMALLGRTGTADESSVTYMIGPAAALGVLGLITMFGLTRRSDRAAEAAGAVAVPERIRTLALASAVVVPATLALVAFSGAVVEFHIHPPQAGVVPDGVSALFVHAQQFGGGVMSAIGGPLLGLLLARYLPQRGAAAVAVVVLVLITILLQGGVVGGDQRYRVLWFWTYFLAPSADETWATLPGNPFLWVLYLAALCVLGVVVAVAHDPEADRAGLRRVVLALAALALVLGVLTMTVGYADSLVAA